MYRLGRSSIHVAPAQRPFVVNNFEGNIQDAVETAPFYTQYTYPYNNSFEASHFIAVPGHGGGQGLGLVVLSTDAASPGNTLGPQTFCGVHPADAHAHYHEETWYSIRFLIPSTGYNLNHGSAQWLFEWHEQTSANVSTAMGLTSWYYSDAPTNTIPDMNKIQLFWRPCGGPDGTPVQEKWVTPFPLISGTGALFNGSGGLLLDTWYQFVVRIFWDTLASGSGGNGALEAYLGTDATGLVDLPMKEWISSSNGDGGLWSNSHPFPTLYDVAGTPDHCNFGLYQYTTVPPSSTEIHYDDFFIGPSRASVGG